MAEPLEILPDVVWYLTSNGRDMWCRAPYGFFFSTAEAARSFAAQQSELELVPIGVQSAQLLSTEASRAMRAQAVTRIFIDPEIDPQSGDVFGTILRFDPPASGN
jgi:hypothetical protein